MAWKQLLLKGFPRLRRVREGREHATLTAGAGTLDRRKGAQNRPLRRKAPVPCRKDPCCPSGRERTQHQC